MIRTSLQTYWHRFSHHGSSLSNGLSILKYNVYDPKLSIQKTLKRKRLQLTRCVWQPNCSTSVFSLSYAQHWRPIAEALDIDDGIVTIKACLVASDGVSNELAMPAKSKCTAITIGGETDGFLA